MIHGDRCSVLRKMLMVSRTYAGDWLTTGPRAGTCWSRNALEHLAEIVWVISRRRTKKKNPKNSKKIKTPPPQNNTKNTRSAEPSVSRWERTKAFETHRVRCIPTGRALFAVARRTGKMPKRSCVSVSRRGAPRFFCFFFACCGT